MNKSVSSINKSGISFKDKLQGNTVHTYFEEWFVYLEKSPVFENYVSAEQLDPSIPFTTFSEEELCGYSDF